jgi:hypothetical protein
VVQKAKEGGLDLAEQTGEHLGKAVYLGLKEWAKESARLSETQIDDLISPFYDQLDQFVIPQIEKLDLDKDGD